MANDPQPAVRDPQSQAMGLDTEFHRGLDLYRLHDGRRRLDDRIGHLIVSADMSRNIGSPGWLLSAPGVLTGVLTIVGRALVRRARRDDAARGRPVRVSPGSVLAALGIPVRLDALLWVIQTGTIAAVSVGFARYLRRAPSLDRGQPLPDRADPSVDLPTRSHWTTTQLVGILMTRAPDLDQHPVASSTERSSRTSSPRPTDRCGAWIDSRRPAARLESRCRGREFRQPVDAAWDGGHRARTECIDRPSVSSWPYACRRPDRCFRPTRGTHHVHGRRGEESPTETFRYHSRSHRPSSSASFCS